MNLYEIDERMVQAFEAGLDPDTGEILDEKAMAEFDTLSLARDEKIENIALFIKNLTADEAVLDKEAKAFATRKKAVTNRKEWLKNYLKGYLNGKPFKAKDGRCTVSFRRTESVNVIDMMTLPDQYLKYSDPEPKKAEIKKAIKAGKYVPGAEIVENQSMIIK